MYLVEPVLTFSPARTVANLSKAVNPTVAVETNMQTGFRPYDIFLRPDQNCSNLGHSGIQRQETKQGLWFSIYPEHDQGPWFPEDPDQT